MFEDKIMLFITTSGIIGIIAGYLSSFVIILMRKWRITTKMQANSINGFFGPFLAKWASCSFCMGAWIGGAITLALLPFFKDFIWIIPPAMSAIIAYSKI